MIDPTMLIIIGIVVIGFGFWWKLRVYWFYRSGAYMKELLTSINEKKSKKQELTSHEKKALRDMNSSLWVWRICSKVGVAMIAIGFILLITQ